MALNKDVMQQASPFSIYQQHLQEGNLAYQFDVQSNRAIFFPRVLSPGVGQAEMEWRISGGAGTIYAVTIVHKKDIPPYNVVLIAMDEGFRMMSRVDDVPLSDIRIGMRVRARISHAGDESELFPVFVAEKTQ